MHTVLNRCKPGPLSTTVLGVDYGQQITEADVWHHKYLQIICTQKNVRNANQTFFLVHRYTL